MPSLDYILGKSKTSSDIVTQKELQINKILYIYITCWRLGLDVVAVMKKINITLRAAVLTLSACGDKAADSKETVPETTVAAATQAENTTQTASTSPATQPPAQKQEPGTTNTQQRQADNDSEAHNAQSSAANNAGETSHGSYQNSSGGNSGKSSAGASSSNSDKTSGSSSPEVPAATVVIDDGDREIVIEQGENELPFIPN